MTAITELHRGHDADARIHGTDEWLHVLVMDNPHNGPDGLWLFVQPDDGVPFRLTADDEVRVRPRRTYTYWLSVADAAAQLRLTAGQVLDLVVGHRLAGRLAFDHQEVSAASVSRLVRCSTRCPELDGVRAGAVAENDLTGGAR